MRSRSLPLVGLAALLIAGIAFGVYFIATDGSAPRHNLAPALPDTDPQIEVPTPPQPEQTRPVETTKPEDTQPEVPAPRDPEPEVKPPPQALKVFEATISGRVVDESGTGVPGVDVRAHLTYELPGGQRVSSSAEAPAETVPTTSTGANGIYQIAIRLELEAELKAVAVSLQAEGPGWSQVQPVEIKSLAAGAKQQRVDVRVAAGGTVVGNVIDEGGGAVSNARIVVFEISEEGGLGRQVATRPGAIMTDDNGGYRIAGLSPGERLFRALKDGYDSQDSEARITVDARGEQQVPVIRLKTMLTIKLKVLKEDGTPINTAGGPAFVTLLIKVEGAPDRTVNVTCGEEGTLTYQGVPHAVVAIHVRAHGYEQSEAVPVHHAAGQDTDLGEVRLQPSAQSDEQEG